MYRIEDAREFLSGQNIDVDAHSAAGGRQDYECFRACREAPADCPLLWANLLSTGAKMNSYYNVCFYAPARSMREMLRKPETPVYRCSECGWTFPLTIGSDLHDFLQMHDAARDYSRHRCAEFERPGRPEKCVVCNPADNPVRLSYFRLNQILLTAQHSLDLKFRCLHNSPPNPFSVTVSCADVSRGPMATARISLHSILRWRELVQSANLHRLSQLIASAEKAILIRWQELPKDAPEREELS